MTPRAGRGPGAARFPAAGGGGPGAARSAAGAGRRPWGTSAGPAHRPAVSRAVAAPRPVAFAPTAWTRRPLVAARRTPQVAVSLHDIAPATFPKVALVRDWLADLGIDRVTLLVIPAPDLHPFDRCAELADWLREQAAAGDEIAQHGFAHQEASARRIKRRAEPDEFCGLDAAAARKRIDAGRRLLELGGLRPTGFVAPGFRYPAGLRAALAREYPWWAGAAQVHRADGRAALRAPALGLRAAPAPGQAATTVRLAARAAGGLLRLELHPADFAQPRHARALEVVVTRAAPREAVTYGELARAR